MYIIILDHSFIYVLKLRTYFLKSATTQFRLMRDFRETSIYLTTLKVWEGLLKLIIFPIICTIICVFQVGPDFTEINSLIIRSPGKHFGFQIGQAPGRNATVR